MQTTRQIKKQTTRQKILRAAASQLKSKGFQQTTVATVMDEVGLTHGSFYAYFKNKNHLILEATNWAIEASNEKIQSYIESRPQPKERFQSFIQMYLSQLHRDTPVDGCPVVALSRDFSLGNKKLRGEFSKNLKQVMDHRRKLFSSETKEITRDEWIGVMSTFIGAMYLSRSCAGDPLSDQILTSAQKFIFECFTKEGLL